VALDPLPWSQTLALQTGVNGAWRRRGAPPGNTDSICRRGAVRSHQFVRIDVTRVLL